MALFGNFAGLAYRPRARLRPSGEVKIAGGVTEYLAEGATSCFPNRPRQPVARHLPRSNLG